MFSMISTLLFWLAALGLLWVRGRTLLMFYQQQEYDSSRFVHDIIKIPLIDLRASIFVILGALVIAFVGGYPLLTLLMAGAVGVVGWMEHRTNQAAKKKLVMTERATRIYQVTLGLIVVLSALVLLIFSAHPLWFLPLIQLTPFAMMLANRVLQPFQKKVNDRFVSDAKSKMRAYKGDVIGITGSFGKTTTKHILGHALEGLSSVYFSHGSINTELGLTRHIREHLNDRHCYFIAEMGAYGIGSIDRLCDLVEPRWGIVTSIGAAHYERFKSLETVSEAKSELAQRVIKNGGKVVLPEALLQYDAFARLDRSHVVLVGESSESDYQIAAQNSDHNGVEVRFKGIETGFALPLLGAHNLDNLALVAAFLLEQGFDASSVALILKSTPQVAHRLEVKDQPGQYLLLDDAYNANETGFRSGLTMLSDLATTRRKNGRRILITPGLVELGAKHDEEHLALGEFANGLVDTALLVRADRIASFAEGFKGETIKLDGFADARQWLAANATANDVVLIANDLPDLIEAKRLL